MRAIRLTGMIIVVFFTFSSCIDSFNPSLEDEENQLVVYGIITNRNGPHYVNVTRTTDPYSTDIEPEAEAQVTLSDNQGNVIDLQESSTGEFVTPSSFTGVIGRQYKLRVETKDGNVYESDWVELIDVPEITELSAKEEITISQDEEKEYGNEFYVTVNEENNSLKYYRWIFEEEWEIKKPFTIAYYWNGVKLRDTVFSQSCYLRRKIDKTSIANTEDYENNIIYEHPLVFSSIDEGRLSTKYCLHVWQYALSDQAYFYWRSQKLNSQEQGTLYDQQPYQLISNIKNVADTTERILGLFEATAVTYKRILVGTSIHGTRYDIQKGLFESCSGTGFNENLPPGYVTPSPPTLYYSIDCAECKTIIGSLARPDYWDEEIYDVE